MDEIKIQVRFPLDLWEEIKRLAEEHERSYNGEVIWALREYVARQKGDIFSCSASSLQSAVEKAFYDFIIEHGDPIELIQCKACSKKGEIKEQDVEKLSGKAYFRDVAAKHGDSIVFIQCRHYPEKEGNFEQDSKEVQKVKK